MFGDGVDECVGVCDGCHYVVAGPDQQAGEAFAEQCRVLGDQDSQQILTWICVPAPAVLTSEVVEVGDGEDADPASVRASMTCRVEP